VSATLADLRDHYGVREWGVRSAPLAVRLLRNITAETSTGCWLWGPRRSANGYGRLRLPSGASATAHRFSYEFFVGPIPAGLQLDHLCQTRECVRPDHLEPVTNQENVQRAWAARPQGDACRNGHVFTPDNTYVRPDRPNRKTCRTCVTDQRHRRNHSR
jgi:hypothetical protein